METQRTSLIHQGCNSGRLAAAAAAAAAAVAAAAHHHKRPSTGPDLGSSQIAPIIITIRDAAGRQPSPPRQPATSQPASSLHRGSLSLLQP